MTLLPVPIADFRANLKKYADMLRAGGPEILVTNHGKAILRCLTPDDVVPEAENPPGVNVGMGDPRYHTGVSGAAGSTLGRGGAGGGLMVTLPGPAGATLGIDPSTGPDLTATTLLHRDDASKVTVVDDIGPRIVAPAVTTPRKRTPKPPPPPKEPKPRGPADLARLLQWPKEAFPVNFQKPRPGKGDDWTLWGQAGHKRVWPGLGKMERAEALGWCIKAVEGQER